MPASIYSDLISASAHFALGLWRETGKEIQVEVRGASMTPLLAAGDRVSLKFLEPGKLKTGDLLAFRQGTNLVVHRFITKKQVNGAWWFCQKGDNTSAWSWVPEDRVLGRAALICSSGRTLNLTRWPWTWLNPCMGLAWSGLAGQDPALAPKSVLPGPWVQATLTKVGNKIFKLLIRGCRRRFLTAATSQTGAQVFKKEGR
jgi:signal peptidase I